MKRRFSKNILFLFLFLLILLSARNSSAKDDFHYTKLAFKFAPLALVDWVSVPSVTGGLEYFINPQYSLEATYGWVFNPQIPNLRAPKGFKTNAELRKYLHPERNKKLRMYFALEYFYRSLSYGTNNSFGDSIHYNEEYNVKKNVWGLNTKFGFQLTILHRALLDVYAGPGIRFKNVRHYNRSHPEDAFYSFEWIASQDRDRAGSYVVPSLALGFKIGYILFKR